MLGLIRESGLPNKERLGLIRELRAASESHEALDAFEESIVSWAVNNPRSIVELSYMAVGAGPGAEQAARAIALMASQESQRISLSTLAHIASGEGEEAEGAKRAIRLIMEVRSTGVKKRSGQGEEADSASSFLDLPEQPHLKGQEASEAGQTTTEPQPPLEELPGGGVRGYGTTPPELPKVKSFRRID